MEASVELMTLEPEKPDPGRPGDFILKAIEGWEGFKRGQEYLWRKGPERPQCQVLDTTITYQFLTVVARQVFFTDLHQAPKGLLWAKKM